MRSREERRAALIQKFREIGGERVERLSAAWLRIEQNPQDVEAQQELLRELHTLKGESLTVGFKDVNLLSHRLESLLTLIHQGQAPVTVETAQVVMSSVDLLGALLHNAADVPTLPVAPMLATIDSLLGKQGASASAPGISPAARPAEPAGELKRSLAGPSMRVRADRISAIAEVGGELLVDQSRTVFSVARLRAASVELDHCLDELAPEAALEAARRLATTLRRELSYLDETIYRKGLHLDHLDHIASELRLLPVSTITDPFARMVRDLSIDQAKDVQLVVTGGDVEADRRVLEALQDPLLHLLRNSIDHGIELPEVRQQQGKARRGTVGIEVLARGSSLIVTVTDDGAGMSPERIAARAVEKQLISAALAQSLNAARALELVFLPGFSTRDEVTQLSGRGVGMDVVKRSVEQVGGRVELQSTPGQGIRVEMVLPISISRTRALVVRVGGFQGAIPSTAIESIVLLSSAEVQQTHQGAAIKVGGELVPLSDLEEVLTGVNDSAAHRPVAIIVRSGSSRRAFRAPEPGREMDLVARPLGPPLERLRLATGAAVLASGDLALILDAGELIARARGHRTGGTNVRQRRHRVLAVDDSVIIQSTVTAILQNLGCEVATAADGLEGLQMLEAFRADLVITDLQMPRLDGIGFIRRMRADERFRSLPVVVLSSLGTVTDRTGAAEAGANAYLVKSELDEKSVRDVVERLL